MIYYIKMGKFWQLFFSAIQMNSEIKKRRIYVKKKFK